MLFVYQRSPTGALFKWKIAELSKKVGTSKPEFNRTFQTQSSDQKFMRPNILQNLFVNRKFRPKMNNIIPIYRYSYDR